MPDNPTPSAREAATRAALAKFFQDRLAEARKILNADVMESLDPGDRKGALLPDGTDIGTVSVTKGRTTVAVVDEAAYLDWVRTNSPHNVHTPEPVPTVRDAYTKALVSEAQVIDGLIVDSTTGEVVPGLQQRVGDPYVSVKISDDQLAEAFRALDDGRLAGLMAEVLQTYERPAIEEGQQA